MSQLISGLAKTTHPLSPGRIENSIAVVGGTASVPVEVTITPSKTLEMASVDLVFLLDDSATMIQNDPEEKRLTCIRQLVALIRYGGRVDYAA